MQSILASAASPSSTIVFSLRSSCLGDLEWAGFIPRFARDSAALGIRRAKLAERRPSRIERARHCERQGVETRPSFGGVMAKHSRERRASTFPGLLRRRAPRNDDSSQTSAAGASRLGGLGRGASPPAGRLDEPSPRLLLP